MWRATSLNTEAPENLRELCVKLFLTTEDTGALSTHGKTPPRNSVLENGATRVRTRRRTLKALERYDAGALQRG